MTEFCQKVLDVWTWQSVEGLEAQSGVICDTRTANLAYIRDRLLRAFRERKILTRSAARRHFSRATS